MSKSSCSLFVKMRKLISSSSIILHREFWDSLATLLREEASRETSPVLLRHFVSSFASALLVHYLQNERIFNFKGQIVTVFQKLPIYLLRVSHIQKHHFHSNLNQNSRTFISKTHLRYVLTLFHFWILRFWDF